MGNFEDADTWLSPHQPSPKDPGLPQRLWPGNQDSEDTIKAENYCLKDSSGALKGAD